MGLLSRAMQESGSDQAKKISAHRDIRIRAAQSIGPMLSISDAPIRLIAAMTGCSAK